MLVNVSQLHMELLNAGLPVCSVRGMEPYADYTRSLTPEEVTLANEIISSHVPVFDNKTSVEIELQNLKNVVSERLDSQEESSLIIMEALADIYEAISSV